MEERGGKEKGGVGGLIVREVEKLADDDSVYVVIGKKGEEKEGREGMSGDEGVLGRVFFFSNGAAVFWGMRLEERQHLLRIAESFENEDENVVVQDSDSNGGGLNEDDDDDDDEKIKMSEFDHEFRFDVDASRRSAGIRNDELLVRDLRNWQELLALSYGMSQSVKLVVYEEALEVLTMQTKQLPYELSKYGQIWMKGKDIKKLMGEIMIAGYSVNLLNELLDTPEFFWEHTEHEEIYKQVYKALDLKKRLGILNERVEIIKECLTILNNELGADKSDRIERAILVLIAVEVVLELVGRFV